MSATSATYRYTALRPDGSRVESRMRAPSEDAVRSFLESDSLRVVQVIPAAANPFEGLMERFKEAREEGGPAVKTLDLATTIKQMEVLMRAGMPPGASVEAVTDSCSSPRLQRVFEEVADRMRQGDSLSAALEHYPRTFPESVRALVSAGEASGSLPDTFEAMYEQLSQQARIESEIRSATAYPRYAGAVALLIALGMIQFLLPQFESIFAQFGSELPAITRFLITVKNQMLYIAGGLIALFVGTKLWLDSIRGNVDVGVKLDKVKFRLPVFGGLLTRQVRYRWCATYAGLQAAGVFMDEALRISGRATGSATMVASTPDVIEAVRDGQEFAVAIEHLPLLLKMEVALAATGERTGRTPETLSAAANAIAQQVNAIIGSLSKRIEVMTLVGVMAGMGVVIAGLWLPILTLSAVASEQF